MILVTGGAGYIGSHYVLHERARGAEVVVLDDLVRGHREAVLDAPLVQGSVGDRACLDRLLGEHRVDAVVHFAALSEVGESVTQPGRYYANNVIGTLTLLEAMREHGIDKIVFSSTCATYGTPRYSPLDEVHPREPINPYGQSKLFCEQMLGAFEGAHGIRHVSLRYFNAAGADPEARIGESHEPESHLVPITLQVALGRRDRLRIFGTDYDTPDGTCIRDYIHVADLVAAHALAMDHLRAGGASGIFNLGTEHGHSVRDVVRACEKVTGRSVNVEEASRRPGDPPRLVASATRARSVLGWQPRYVDLEETIATAWRWEQARRF